MSLTDQIENFLFIKRFSVYYWKDYEFQDNNKERNKFIITLNCEANEFPLSIILPTSKDDEYFYSQPKNLIDCVLFDIGESEFFTYKKNKTIVDLKNIYKEDKEFITAAHQENELIFKGILEVDLQNRIIQAIEDSITLDEYEIDKLLCR